MAYRAEIEIGVRGIRQLEALKQKIEQVSTVVERLTQQSIGYSAQQLRRSQFFVEQERKLIDARREYNRGLRDSVRLAVEFDQRIRRSIAFAASAQQARSRALPGSTLAGLLPSQATATPFRRAEQAAARIDSAYARLAAAATGTTSEFVRIAGEARQFKALPAAGQATVNYFQIAETAARVIDRQNAASARYAAALSKLAAAAEGSISTFIRFNAGVSNIAGLLPQTPLAGLLPGTPARRQLALPPAGGTGRGGNIVRYIPDAPYTPRDFTRGITSRFGGNVSGAVGSGIIGGAFPLLFGQGPLAAAGGGIGGFAGGLLGGSLGFGLSLVGTAIGDAAQKTLDLEKAITGLNTKFMETSAQTRITYTDIENLAGSLKITKEEAVDAVKEFAGYGKSALALTQAFSGLGGAATFETIASAGTSEKSALQAIVQLRSLIGVEAAKNLLTNLKNNGALGTQEKLLDLILEKQFDVNTEAAKQINPWDRTRELIAQSLALVYKLIDSLKDIKLPLPSLPGLPEFKFGLDFLDLSKPIADLESVTAESIRDERMSDIFKLRNDIVTSLDTQTDLQKDINSLQKEYNKLSKQDAAKRAAEAARDLTERLQRQLELATAKTEKDRTTLRILFEYRDNLKAIQRLEDQSQSAQQLKLANDLYSLALHKQTADELDRYLKTLVAIVDKGPALGMQAFSGGPFGAPVQDLTGLAFGTQGTFAKVSPAEETLLRAKKSLEDLLEPANQAQVIAQGIGTAFTDSFKSVIDGSATAQEALANMFNRIADAFFDMAAQIITQLLVIKAIESAISFFGGGATAKSFSGAGPYSYPSDLNIPFTIPGKAMGGPVSAGSPYMVGERGPELFIPGKSGTIVPNSSLGGANVVVNVDASGSRAQGNQADASALGRAIGAAVQAELVRQKRPGGLLT